MAGTPQWKPNDKSVTQAPYGTVYGAAYSIALRPDGRQMISGLNYEVGRTAAGEQYMRSMQTGKIYVFSNGALLTHAIGTGNIDTP